MPLSKFKVLVKVSNPQDNAKLTQEQQFTDITMQSDSKIGTYNGLSGSHWHEHVHIEVTLIFSRLDNLSLPTTASINTKKTLRLSLNGPSFIDTKFYLFSARVDGKVGHPKVVYANSALLTESSGYLHDLLSTEPTFKDATSCDLRRDVPEEIAKLDAGAYDYDSDSDLEDESEGKGEDSATTTPSEEVEKTVSEELATRFQDGRAFAINGTAHKTWKAFIYYCYTNEIHFNELKSRCNLAILAVQPDPKSIKCSPKSMYRFADYANLPELMSLTKEAIRMNLTQLNIVEELFSRFTSKYQEIIELETHYLVENYTPYVARDFEQMLERVAAGAMPHCGHVLKTSVRKLRAGGSSSATLAPDVRR